MDYYVTADKQNMLSLIEKKRILVANVRKSRLKCKQLAVVELVSVLLEYEPQFVTNGPLGDVKGVISIAISIQDDALNGLKNALEKVGYCSSFYLLDFKDLQSDIPNPSINPLVWKGKAFSIKILHQQDAQAFRQEAADKRPFSLECGDGVVRTIQGYRGDGSATGRRALPVEDCRMMSNIACSGVPLYALDAFAGAGGIVFQICKNYPQTHVISVDIAPELATGLRKYGAEHYVCSSAEFVPNHEIGALCTEVPFDRHVTHTVCAAFRNLRNYLTDEAKIVIMCADYQNNDICEALVESGYTGVRSQLVDRKGTDVMVILAYTSDYVREGFDRLWEKLVFFK